MCELLRCDVVAAFADVSTAVRGGGCGQRERGYFGRVLAAEETPLTTLILENVFPLQ
jgi:hypothetical protein